MWTVNVIHLKIGMMRMRYDTCLILMMSHSQPFTTNSLKILTFTYVLFLFIDTHTQHTAHHTAHNANRCVWCLEYFHHNIPQFNALFAQRATSMTNTLVMISTTSTYIIQFWINTTHRIVIFLWINTLLVSQHRIFSMAFSPAKRNQVFQMQYPTNSKHFLFCSIACERVNSEDCTRGSFCFPCVPWHWLWL